MPATFNDINSNKIKLANLDDDLKEGGMDVALPKEDYNSGWMYLAKNASITISHNLAAVPRLFSLFKNTTASDINAYQIGTQYLNTVTGFSIVHLNSNQLVIKNYNTANAYFKLLLWE